MKDKEPKLYLLQVIDLDQSHSSSLVLPAFHRRVSPWRQCHEKRGFMIVGRGKSEIFYFLLVGSIFPIFAPGASVVTSADSRSFFGGIVVGMVSCSCVSRQLSFVTTVPFGSWSSRVGSARKPVKPASANDGPIPRTRTFFASVP